MVRRTRPSMLHETQQKPPAALLIGVPLPGVSDADNEDSLAELARLVTTLGYRVVGTLSQRRHSLSGSTVLGEGKLQELCERTGGSGQIRHQAKKSKAALKQEPVPLEDLLPEEELEPLDDAEPGERAEMVVFDCDLSPSQLSNLARATGAEVLDRTGVIVDIFSRHARSRIARAQVEIARLSYAAPRMRATGQRSQRVNIAGENQLELDRRKVRDRIAELKHEVEQLQEEQASRRDRRAEQYSVALVGYTNAGKSSLMRRLTGSEVLVEDKLFATLDTTVRALQPDQVPRILISDTVGFIKKLPHDLVASFRSTLDEAAQASLLLYVTDASDPSFRSQLEVTRETIAAIDAADVPSRLVLNKTDLLNPGVLDELRAEYPEAIFLSTRDERSVAELVSEIRSFFAGEMSTEEMFVPYAAGGVVGPLRSRLKVLEEQAEESGMRYQVQGKPADLAFVRGLL